MHTQTGPRPAVRPAAGGRHGLPPLALGACGSSGGGSSNNETSGSTPANSSDTVSVEHVASVGDVLVDRNGMALYTPEQEANGMILCTGACESFWKPCSPARARRPRRPASPTLR